MNRRRRRRRRRVPGSGWSELEKNMVKKSFWVHCERERERERLRGSEGDNLSSYQTFLEH
jgi:hypothetical protein